MAILLKGIMPNNQDLIMRSNTIIGVMGNRYQEIFKLLMSDNLYYMDINYSFSQNTVMNEIINQCIIEDKREKIDVLLKQLSMPEDFLNFKISELSNGMKKMLKYMMMFLHDQDIFVIDEPFVDLDYFYKKKIISLFKSVIHNEKKTIIIGSNDSNIIYSLCSNVLIVNDKKYIYGKTLDLMVDKKTSEEYNIEMPDIVTFINYAKEVGANIGYSRNVHDLIKDVYRNV